jgi:hypothetical protein
MCVQEIGWERWQGKVRRADDPGVRMGNASNRASYLVKQRTTGGGSLSIHGAMGGW